MSGVPEGISLNRFKRKPEPCQGPPEHKAKDPSGRAGRKHGERPVIVAHSVGVARSDYWNCRTASIIFRALYGFGTNKLPAGISSPLGAP
jgi:hypothetical protein